MPNYVYGTLSVTGNKDELSKFKEFAENEEEYIDDMDNHKVKTNKNILDMGKFIPYPQKFKDIDQRNKEYYEWVRGVKMKVEQGETNLTTEERKIADELALQELGDGQMEYRKDGYNSGGYEWCCKNWGTKWNFCDVDLNTNTDTELCYNFQTAWSVPMPVLFKMSEMFPELTFEYSGNEESEEFEVEYKFRKGEMEIQSEKVWEDIQIEKIKEGNLDNFEHDDKLYEELEKHYGHDIEYVNDDKVREFRCKTCDNKCIWDCNK